VESHDVELEVEEMEEDFIVTTRSDPQNPRTRAREAARGGGAAAPPKRSLTARGRRSAKIGHRAGPREG